MFRRALHTARFVLRAIQLTLPKIGIGWMFALLTSNFNRIAIYELGVLAVLVTTMLGLYHFLSPFQVMFGRLADRYPILGYRRSPYLLLGLLVSSLVFLALPSVARAMGAGSLPAIVAGFALLIVFGVGFAAAGAAHLALIADVTTPRSRGIVVALVWTMQIGSVIVAAVFMKQLMPSYSPEAMQAMYNMTPAIVLIPTALALLGNERRLRGAELAETVGAAREASTGGVVRFPLQLLRGNRAARYFFAFIICSTLGVFLQDSILEVFGAQVLGMSVKETTSFQQIWGGGVLLAMLVVGGIIAVRPFSRQRLAAIGGVGTTAGLALLAATALLGQRALINPALIVMGVFTGLYTVGALSLMMEMQVEGATATYMGLWGMAQALGNGGSSIGAGALHSALIGSHLFGAGAGYAIIFGIEAALMLAGVLMLGRVSLPAFHEGLTTHDLTQTLELGAA
ncbi:MAG: BCD family MFS transporter [Kouleothrix sp.]|nr:BCD family MFS transporter [Kouleothrix sp.]